MNCLKKIFFMIFVLCGCVCNSWATSVGSEYCGVVCDETTKGQNLVCPKQAYFLSCMSDGWNFYVPYSCENNGQAPGEGFISMAYNDNSPQVWFPSEGRAYNIKNIVLWVLSKKRQNYWIFDSIAGNYCAGCRQGYEFNKEKTDCVPINKNGAILGNVCSYDVNEYDRCGDFPTGATDGYCRTLKSGGVSQMTCAAINCKPGYYLWLNEKTGSSQGICHSEKTAYERCTNKCSGCSGKCVPNIVDTPSFKVNNYTYTPRSLGAYQGCKCEQQCPQGATGDYPNCNCGEGKNYDRDNNTCVQPGQTEQPQPEQKCPDGVEGVYPTCCEAPQTKYDAAEGKCKCPDDRPEFKDGQCVQSEQPQPEPQCPEEAPGDYPNCNCGEGKNYDQNNNTCVQPEQPQPEQTQPEQPQPEQKCPSDATGTPPNCKCTDKTKLYDADNNECVLNKLEDLRKKYQDAKEKEQSLANRTLTATTTAAMGIGGMELASGLAEQSADAAADRDMTAYMATFRCSYADGKSVKGGLEEIELPGGNDEKITKYRNEYFALASSLKERKESLNMKPGIESETIFDKAEMGLYDDENVGITGGTYSSLYRAKMGSETDAAMIAADQETSANRVKYGAIAVGAGAAVGIVGNSLINGKLGKKIEEAKADQNSKKKESDALKDLKQCLKDAGATNYDKLNFDKFTPSVLNLDNIDCKKDLKSIAGKDATTLFVDSDDAAVISSKLTESFGEEKAGLMLGDAVIPGMSAEVVGERVVMTPTGKPAVKMTRFKSDTGYGDGIGYCYNFIDGFVRGNISGAGCSSLEPGDWMTSFENGNVRGVSVCSLVRPEGMSHGFTPNETVQAQIQNSYDLWVKNGRQRPNDDDEMGCYCKMNGGGRWVFDSYWSGYHCKTACAYFCAYLVGDAGQQAFREAVLKKY